MHRPIATRRIRRTLAVAAGAISLLTASLAATTAGPVGAATPYCGITWGSLARSNTRMVPGPIVNVRGGQHPCYDRLVVDLRTRPAPGYAVRYVSAVRADPSNKLVPLRGGAFLEIVVRAPAYDLSGHATYRPAHPTELVPVTGFRTFRQVASAGSFEGITTIGLGVRARLPFRVFMLNGPGSGSRLVIDVAHQWTS